MQRYANMSANTLMLMSIQADKNLTLGESEQLHYASQISGAMAFITSKKIVHLDLAGRNVLYVCACVGVCVCARMCVASPGCHQGSRFG